VNLELVFTVTPEEAEDESKLAFWKQVIWSYLSKIRRLLWRFYRIRLSLTTYVGSDIVTSPKGEYYELIELLKQDAERSRRLHHVDRVIYAVSNRVVRFTYHQYGEARIDEGFAWAKVWSYGQTERYVDILKDRFTVDYEHTVQYFTLVRLSHELCHLLLNSSPLIDGGAMSGAVFFKRSFWDRIWFGWLFKPAKKLQGCFKPWAPKGEPYPWDYVMQRYSLEDPYCPILSLYKRD